jgi:rifampicin phosphotransferase
VASHFVFIRLDAITDADLPLTGGKAFNCARLRQAGFPVPDGLVVPSAATDEDVRRVASDAWILAQSADALFAVRSSGLGEDSAGHSFAGLHDTQLNVGRDRLVDAVLACRQSAGSPAAVAYRRARQIAHAEASIAVLVQVMVPAVTSGVAFTVNPVTGVDELVVDAARGFGEALVSGQIDPDEFRIGKTDGAILSSRITASTPTMSPAELDALAALLKRIEQHFCSPQDVEWCHDGRQFWIVQSRPVTSHPAPRTSHLSDVEWTRANLVEVLPDQMSPQALTLYADLLDRGERAFFGRLMAPEAELGPIVKAFHGRLYFNLSQLRHVTETVGAAPADTLRSLGHSEAIHPEDEIARRPRLRQLLPALPDLVRLIVNMLQAQRIFHAHEAHVEQLLAQLNAVDPRTLPDAAIVSTFEGWIDATPDTLKAVFVMGGVQMHEDALRKACKAVGFPYERLVYPQLAAGARSVSTQQAVDLVALAELGRDDPAVSAYFRANDGRFADCRIALAGTPFLQRFDAFLRQYGHRGRYESDWSLPRLHENPAPVLFAIRALLEAPPQDIAAQARRQQEEAAAAWREFEQRLTLWQRWTLLPRVRSAIRRLKNQYVWREAIRSDLTRVVSRVREWHLALADRFVERGWIDRRDDYFLLELSEVERAALDPARGPELRAIAATRAAQLAAERDLRMPLLMRESELPALLQAGTAVAAAADDAGALTGLCVSPGAVEADVVVMRDPGEFAAMKRGAILVTVATDPSWTPLFTLASGVIVEVGGMLSHASTIAREYGLPALANVKGATRLLQTGDRVRLNASGGRVDVVSRRAAL